MGPASCPHTLFRLTCPSLSHEAGALESDLRGWGSTDEVGVRVRVHVGRHVSGRECGVCMCVLCWSFWSTGSFRVWYLHRSVKTHPTPTRSLGLILLPACWDTNGDQPAMLSSSGLPPFPSSIVTKGRGGLQRARAHALVQGAQDRSPTP